VWFLFGVTRGWVFAFVVVLLERSERWDLAWMAVKILLDKTIVWNDKQQKRNMKFFGWPSQVERPKLPYILGSFASGPESWCLITEDTVSWLLKMLGGLSVLPLRIRRAIGLLISHLTAEGNNVCHDQPDLNLVVTIPRTTRTTDNAQAQPLPPPRHPDQPIPVNGPPGFSPRATVAPQERSRSETNCSDGAGVTETLRSNSHSLRV
jgi:hypothetical protein